MSLWNLYEFYRLIGDDNDCKEDFRKEIKDLNENNYRDPNQGRSKANALDLN